MVEIYKTTSEYIYGNTHFKRSELSRRNIITMGGNVHFQNKWTGKQS